MNTSYTMPSKTLAHAYKGTTTLLTNGMPPNKLNEYTNIEFIESRGKAFVPVRNALFGRTRMAKDRIHWMFSPNKDERVSSLLSWIQKVEYQLGSYGVSFRIDERRNLPEPLTPRFINSFKLENVVPFLPTQTSGWKSTLINLRLIGLLSMNCSIPWTVHFKSPSPFTILLYRLSSLFSFPRRVEIAWQCGDAKSTYRITLA